MDEVTKFMSDIEEKENTIQKLQNDINIKNNQIIILNENTDNKDTILNKYKSEKDELELKYTKIEISIKEFKTKNEE